MISKSTGIDEITKRNCIFGEESPGQSPAFKRPNLHEDPAKETKKEWSDKVGKTGQSNPK